MDVEIKEVVAKFSDCVTLVFPGDKLKKECNGVGYFVSVNRFESTAPVCGVAYKRYLDGERNPFDVRFFFLSRTMYECDSSRNYFVWWIFTTC